MELRYCVNSTTRYLSRKLAAAIVASMIVLACTGVSSSQTAAKRPNVVIFLADDMGYSDLGCFGGEIHTPNLDRMAHNGLRYTQFYNTTRCWPSRASILTGYYAQQVRRDTLPDVPHTGAGGVRPAWARLLPELLKPAGYRTYHSGKWHLDGKALDTGFDHSYMLVDTDRHFYPREHMLDDKPLPPVELDAGYYSTTAIANYAIRWLKDHQKHYMAQPFCTRRLWHSYVRTFLCRRRQRISSGTEPALRQDGTFCDKNASTE